MRTNRGIIGTIVLLVIALIILGYFNIDLKTVFSAPAVKENLAYAWELFVEGWQHFVTLLVSLFHMV